MKHIVTMFISKKIVHDFSAKPDPQTMSVEEGIFTRVSLGVWKFQCQAIVRFNPTAYAAREDKWSDNFKQALEYLIPITSTDKIQN